MRKKEYLSNPNLDIKEYRVKDFSKITDYSLHVNLTDKVEANNVGFQLEGYRTGKMVKGYFVANRMFFYMSDKRFFEYRKQTFNAVLSNITEPLVIDVIINGNKEILLIESTSAYILKKDIKFTFPYGNSIANYDGRLFVAKDKNIYYSNVFNFTEYSTNIENVGFISVDDEGDNILDLIPFADCMYVVCKKAIHKLTITNGEFELKKCEINHVNILQDSAKKIGNKIYFISNYRLCVFDGNSVKGIDGEFDRFLGSATESATTSDGFYSIKVFINSNPVFLVYDTFNGKHHYIWIHNLDKAYVNGYMFIDRVSSLYKIKYTKAEQRYCWFSKAMDFSSAKKKMLLEVGLTVATPLELTIEGDFGVKKVQLNKGQNVKKLCLTSRFFKFSVNVRKVGFLIEDLSFKYRILGG